MKSHSILLQVTVALTVSSEMAFAQVPLGSVLAKAVELEQACLRNRYNISQGYVSLEVQSVQLGDDATANARAVALVSIWFKEGKLRFDRQLVSPNGEMANREITIVESDKYIHIPWQVESGGRLGFQKEYENAILYFRMFHPRWLGMGVNDEVILHQDANSRAVGTAELLNPSTVERSNELKVKSWKIYFFQELKKPKAGGLALKPVGEIASDELADHTPNDRELRTPGDNGVVVNLGGPRALPEISPLPEVATDTHKTSPNRSHTVDVIKNTRITWISPEQGYGLLRATSEQQTPDNNFLQELDNELRPFGEGCQWYPYRVSRRQKRNGVVTSETTIVTKEADFDSVIPDKVFTLKGLGLTNGHKVFDRTRGPEELTLLVDGDQIIEMTPVVNANAVTDIKQSTARRVFLLLNCAALATLSALYFVRFVRQRRMSK